MIDPVAETTARVLTLLGLLQTHRRWPGPELARRLDVTGRTLRRDVERLRALGYPVVAARGAAGGYHLEAGTAVPPLVLTDDEAVATAIGLRVAAAQGLADGEVTALGALAKLEQVLPARLRRRVNALAEHVAPLPGGSSEVAPALLGTLALACRDHERVRFVYVAADGASTSRRVEPHSLVAAGRRFLLVAWDELRDDWRTFRLDRMGALVATGTRTAPRELPAEDAAALVAGQRWESACEVEVELDLPLDRARAHLGSWGADLAALDGGRTRWRIAADRPEAVVCALVWVPRDLVVSLHGGPGVLAAVHDAAGGVVALAGCGDGGGAGGADPSDVGRGSRPGAGC